MLRFALLNDGQCFFSFMKKPIYRQAKLRKKVNVKKEDWEPLSLTNIGFWDYKISDCQNITTQSQYILCHAHFSSIASNEAIIFFKRLESVALL